MQKKANKEYIDELTEWEDELPETLPNIIFVQLESFFDVSEFKRLKTTTDPLPNLRKMAEEYSSIDILFYFAKQIAKNSGLVKKGDTIVITAGTPNGKSGNSNLINVETL